MLTQHNRKTALSWGCGLGTRLKMAELRSSSSLPSAIDPTVAIDAFRTQRDQLLNLLQRSLHGAIFDSLCSSGIIPEHVRDTMRPGQAPGQGPGKSNYAFLLDCLESRIEAVPSDFTVVVLTLEKDHFLQQLAKDLVQSYCE